jgi:hypothetical protein
MRTTRESPRNIRRDGNGRLPSLNEGSPDYWIGDKSWNGKDFAAISLLACSMERAMGIEPITQCPCLARAFPLVLRRQFGIGPI